MFKYVGAGLLSVLMSSVSVANAETVYRAEKDQWSVTGYWDYNKKKPGSCVLNTVWEDSTSINLNVFPDMNLDENVTLTIYSPTYDYDRAAQEDGHDKNVIYNSTARFINGGNVKTLKFNWQWFLKNNQNTVIIRELSDTFLDLFLRAETVTFFPDSHDALLVGLKGTQALLDTVVECEMAVTGQLE